MIIEYKEDELDLDKLKAKLYSENNYIKDKIYKNIIFIIIYTIFIFFLFFSIFLYYIYLKFIIILKGKDKQLNNLKRKLNNNKIIWEKNKNPNIGKQTFTNLQDSWTLDRDIKYDINIYSNNTMDLYDNMNKIGYSVIINSHSIEKGLSHFKLRRFGGKKIKTIINLIKKYSIYQNYEKDFSFILGVNIIREYVKVYKENNWIKEKEYRITSDYIKNLPNIKTMKLSPYIIEKEELIKKYKINYLNFVKSRHSLRNYKKKKLKSKDIRKAIQIAKYTPSACNRQNIKVHYYSNWKMRQNIIKYINCKDGINLDSVNIFIITFDINGLYGSGGRNQGYFNAGLFSMNLINSFHSMGIGSCFIQYDNNYNEEEKLKNFIKIPLNERIAVIILAGYYKNKSKFTISQRKELSDYLIVHN